MIRKNTLSSALLILLPFLAQAHGGHGHFPGHELAHYLASPGHAIPILAVLVLSIVVIVARQRAWAKKRADK
jgi:uncharacterized membrane protein